MRIGGSTILALTLSQREIVCALTETRSGTHVTKKIAHFESPTAILDRPESTGETLAAFLEKHQMSVNRVIVGVPASWVIAQEKDLPPVATAEAAAILRLQAERMSTGESDSLVVDAASDLDKTSGKVLLVGILRQQLQKIEKLVHSAGLQLVAICPTALATSAMIESDHAMLKIGDGDPEMVNWQNGAARSIRPLTSDNIDQLSGEFRRILAMQMHTGSVRVCDGVGLSDREKQSLSARLGNDAAILDSSEFNVAIDPSAMNGSASAFKSNSHLPAVALSLVGLNPHRLPVNFIDSRLAPEKSRRLNRAAYLAIAAGVAVVVGIGLLIHTVHTREAEELQLANNLKELGKPIKAAEDSLSRFRFGRVYFEHRSGYLDAMRQLSLAFNYDESIWITSINLRDGGEGQMQGKTTDQRLILSLRDRLMNDKTFEKVQLIDLRESGGRGGEISWSISFLYKQAVTQ